MRQEIRPGSWSESVAFVAPVGEIYDATANDSDKSWVVPGNEMWRLNFAYVLLAATTAVGSRLVTIRVKDASGNTIAEVVSGVGQVATTTRTYMFMQGIFRETAFTNDAALVAIPDGLWLKPGYTLQVLDKAAIDVAADDMTVAVQYEKYTV